MIRNIERVSVYYHGKHVGTLQQTADDLIRTSPYKAELFFFYR